MAATRGENKEDSIKLQIKPSEKDQNKEIV